jgi:hypothetical protein
MRLATVTLPIFSGEKRNLNCPDIFLLQQLPSAGRKLQK